MTKILKIESEIQNPDYVKAVADKLESMNVFKKIYHIFSFGLLDVGVPMYIKNPRVAEIFSDLPAIKEWHVDRGYFYIEVPIGYKVEDDEVYEIKVK